MLINNGLVEHNVMETDWTDMMLQGLTLNVLNLVAQPDAEGLPGVDEDVHDMLLACGTRAVGVSRVVVQVAAAAGVSPGLVVGAVVVVGARVAAWRRGALGGGGRHAA